MTFFTTWRYLGNRPFIHLPNTADRCIELIRRSTLFLDITICSFLKSSIVKPCIIISSVV